MSEALAIRLAGMLGADVGVGQANCSGTDGLYPEEQTAISNAVERRRVEFAAGRRAARAALAQIGAPAIAIPLGAHRAPRWPVGITGSITHERDVALAAVTRRGWLGIDVTEAAPLPENTRRAILPHPEEAGLNPIAERAGFSAKESLFKALFPLVGRYFGFSAARVWPDLDSGHFRIELAEPLGAFSEGTGWDGTLAIEGPHLVTALRLADDDPVT